MGNHEVSRLVNEYGGPKYRFSTDYHHVLARYLKNLNNLIRDYRQCRRDHNFNVMAVDFSEIFLYMFNTRTSRPDLHLVKYLFDSSRKRDFKYVMLPPGIVELRLHYEKLRRTANKYRLHKPRNVKELRLIYNKFNPLWKRDERRSSVLNHEEYDELKSLWRSYCMRFHSFDAVARMVTDIGSGSLIDESHKRLINLFTNRVIRPLKEVSGDIQVSSNDSVFSTVLSDLEKSRPKANDVPRNLPDAEQAAIDYQMNRDMRAHKERTFDLMNIFTGSPAPLKAYERHLLLSEQSLPLVRCPIYMMIRTFCQNELTSSFSSAMDFLQAGIDVVVDLMRWSPSKGIDVVLASKIKEHNESRQRTYLYNKARHYEILFDIFRLNEGFSGYFYDALKSHNFNKEWKADFQQKFFAYPPEVLRPMQVVEISDLVINRQKDFEEKLAHTEERIYRNLMEAYKNYIEWVKNLDIKLLSPRMREHYEFILSQPTELQQPTDIL